MPASARRIDATGKYLVPGLWDAHVHFMNATAVALPVFLANGVTSVREMGGFLDSTRAWQARMQNGTLVGPRLVTPGGMLENPRYLAGVPERSARLGGRLAPRILPYRAGVGDAADARRVVDSLAALGVDFVKFRTVASPDALFALLREARRAGLKVAGHSPGVVPAVVAVDSGQDDVEHALFISDSATRSAVARTFAARGTWYTPTLIVSRAVTIPGDSAERLVFGPHALASHLGRRYAAPWLLEWWRMQIDERKADTANVGAARAETSFAASREDVRAFAAAGVRILAGTDAGSVLVYPGFSLHEELAMLVEAGLTPQQALWSATAGPSQFAGLDGAVGRVAPGYVADLVLLDADPLARIANTRRIDAVIQGGRLYDRSTLDSLLTALHRQVTAAR
ncbi:MAG: amidohydrolase family protein [Longimicrobiales bacterium]